MRILAALSLLALAGCGDQSQEIKGVNMPDGLKDCQAFNVEGIGKVVRCRDSQSTTRSYYDNSQETTKQITVIQPGKLNSIHDTVFVHDTFLIARK